MLEKNPLKWQISLFLCVAVQSQTFPFMLSLAIYYELEH